MRITHVLTAVNDNPNYTKYIPLFLTQWKLKYGEITPVILYVGTEIPSHLSQYADSIRLFPPFGTLSTATIAQVIRLLYPCLLPDDAVVLITDMDMIPGHSAYFQQAASMIPDSAFGSLRPKEIVAANQIAICYNVARANVWRSIFNIHSVDDIVSFFETNVTSATDGQHGGSGWYTDQEILYRHCMAWQQKGGSVVFLKDNQTHFHRLDHFHHNYNIPQFIHMITQNYYADCHLYAHMCTWSADDISQIISAFQGHNTS
jgi:hypothetical protein